MRRIFLQVTDPVAAVQHERRPRCVRRGHWACMNCLALSTRVDSARHLDANLRLGCVRLRAWRDPEVPRRSRALARPRTAPPAHAALESRPSTRVQRSPAARLWPVCVRRWRRQAVERSPSAAVVPARGDSAENFSAPMRRRAGACGVSAVRWRPCGAANARVCIVLAGAVGLRGRLARTACCAVRAR